MRIFSAFLACCTFFGLASAAMSATPSPVTVFDSTGTYPLAIDTNGTAPIRAALGAFASGSVGDGAIVTLGTEADSAYAGSGSASVISILKGIYTNVGSAIPTGTNSIGTLNAANRKQTNALASSLAIKTASGTLYTFNISADSTLSGSIWYILGFDTTSLPADGAVTPALCIAVPAGVINATDNFGDSGVAMSFGMFLSVSTTGCFTKTSSTHALFISATYR